MINTNLMNLLEKAMGGSAMRHKVLTNNLANVNTPNFKRNDVSFQATLEGAVSSQLPLKTTKPGHLQVSPTTNEVLVFQDESTSLRNDGNNVDIDVELATLAQNNLYFNSLVTFLSSQLNLLKQSITEGRR